MFADGHWIRAQGSEAVIDAEEGDLCLGLAVRNAGAGIAVLQGWCLWPELVRSDVGHRALEEFRRQVPRHLHRARRHRPVAGRAPPGRRRTASELLAARSERRPFAVDLLYSDQVGAQRTISRFAITPADEDRWLGSVGLHWNLDQMGPR
jgi:hypothetical protein